jgi:hypothetical protein
MFRGCETLATRRIVQIPEPRPKFYVETRRRRRSVPAEADQEVEVQQSSYERPPAPEGVERPLCSPT